MANSLKTAPLSTAQDLPASESGLGLVRYDAMIVAIDACVAVDEVKEIRDKARALEVYASQAMNRDAEQKAASVRIRAERKTGELLADGKTNGDRHSGRGNNRKLESDDATPKLSDLGISRDQSSQWQKLAAIPKEEFEEALAAPGVPTTEGILRSAGTPKIHCDPDALWAYSRIREFEKIMERPASELFALMQDFQQEHLSELVPVLTSWLKEMR
jgi:hypothetical protein